ncbi:MAG: hypothetical protein RB191_20650 [Terriglobia bacterium]|nr:hypothetical protein [Terriglobia bacterium]
MSEEEALAVGPNEQLARFVFYKGWIRSSDSTIRPDAFIPHPHHDLSVTRHNDLSGQQLWDIGRNIAISRQKPLLGRADVSAATVRCQSLEIAPDPVHDNPNHAIISGWPADKAAQKSIAQQLAEASTFRKPASIS